MPIIKRHLSIIGREINVKNFLSKAGARHPLTPPDPRNMSPAQLVASLLSLPPRMIGEISPPQALAVTLADSHRAEGDAQMTISKGCRSIVIERPPSDPA
jgi:hypothetical protein